MAFVGCSLAYDLGGYSDGPPAADDASSGVDAPTDGATGSDGQTETDAPAEGGCTIKTTPFKSPMNISSGGGGQVWENVTNAVTDDGNFTRSMMTPASPVRVMVTYCE